MKKMVIIGAGNRGLRYADEAMKLDGCFEITAVCEPIKERREYIAKKYSVSDELVFESWEPLIAMGKIADVAVIATMDRDHLAPAVAALRAGYDLLIEKPVCPTLEECELLLREAERCGRLVLVCHVLRYTPFFNALKTLIDSGKLGRIMNIQHIEGVGNIHQSHSFVRGNWGNTARSTPMILQKTCHDMDILQWLVGKRCLSVQSFGALSYFKRENAPKGAPEFCIQGCPVADECPYNALKLYCSKGSTNWFRGAASRMHEPTDEAVLEAIKTTNYGRCVFRCDNDVVDHQTVNLLFEDDITVSFTMSAFTKGGRDIRIMGTEGELIASMSADEMTFNNFRTGKTETISVGATVKGDSIMSGHGGGDSGIIRALYEALSGGSLEGLSTLDISVENHKIAFAAEASRLLGGETVRL